jgi:phosphoglycolate phosphatase
MRYRLVIFDIDGTLVDSFAWFTSILNDVADRYRFRRVEAGEIETLRGLGAREIVRRLGVPAWKVPLIAAHMHKRKREALPGMRLFDGTGSMLRGLHGCGIGLAAVSSDTEANVRDALGAELAALIGRYECGASLFGKAVKFRKVLSAAACEPGEALAIGDEIRDLEAAHAVGIAFGAVGWGYTRPDALRSRRPDEMFETMDQICERLCAAKRQPAVPAPPAA